MYYLIISTAAIISIKYRFCLSCRSRNTKAKSQIECNRFASTISNKHSGCDNKICFVGTSGLFQIFRPSTRKLWSFKTILNGIKSPTILIIWQKTVYLILFCQNTLISIHILWKSGNPTEYFTWGWRVPGNLVHYPTLQQYLLGRTLGDNYQRNFAY